MKLKRLIPLTFSAVSLVSIPSIVCSCGKQYQPDYTIRCDTTEITWSLSQTTETDELLLYTKDKLDNYQIWVNNSSFGAYLHKDKDGPSLGIYIKPNWNPYEYQLWFNNLTQAVTISDYWLKVTGFNYGENVYGKGSLSHNDIWFKFNIIE